MTPPRGQAGQASMPARPTSGEIVFRVKCTAGLQARTCFKIHSHPVAGEQTLNAEVGGIFLASLLPKHPAL